MCANTQKHWRPNSVWKKYWNLPSVEEERSLVLWRIVWRLVLSVSCHCSPFSPALQLLVLLINNFLIKLSKYNKTSKQINTSVGNGRPNCTDQEAIEENWLFKIVTFSHLLMLRTDYLTQLRKQFSLPGRSNINNWRFWRCCLSHWNWCISVATQLHSTVVHCGPVWFLSPPFYLQCICNQLDS